MKIRKAETSDIDKVAEIVRGLSHYYMENGQNELPEWFRATLTDSAFSRRFSDCDYFNFVAEIDGAVVGYISVKSGFHLYHLFVASGFHNQGIAKRLWQHCVCHLKIEQCTVRSSLFAVPVYYQFGFRVSGSSAFKDGIGFQPMVYSGASC
jgi:predicted N-acetyltransferase YhbS